MKKFLTPVLFLLFLTFTSCSTEEVTIDPVTENPINPENPQNPTGTNFTEENPLPEFLAETRYNEFQSVCTSSSSFDEIGFKFKVLEKGTINSLIVKIPVTNNSLIVTITDFATNQIVRTEEINVTAANTEFVKTIVPLELEKNKIYNITMLTNKYYKRFRSDFSQPQYPVTAGNIKIMFPITTAFSPDGVTFGGSGNFYSGDCSFTFLRTE